MVIDTSALVAILQDKPERHVFNEAIEAASILSHQDRRSSALRL